MLMLMTDSTKIKEGTFAGSYTAPKRRRWGLITIIVVAALLLAGAAGWFIWQNEMSKQLDQEIYSQAIENSKDVNFQYLNDIQRNAQFQKHAGITMDAYIKSPRTIKSADDKYACAKLLSTGNHPKESAALYAEMINDNQVPEGADPRAFYKEVAMLGKRADDELLVEKASSKYKEVVMSSDSLSDSLKEYLMEVYENEIQ